jgi:hypothetical protein
LLKAVAWVGVGRFGFDHSDGQVGSISEQVVGAFSWPAAASTANDDNSAVRERDLLVEAVRFVIPARSLKLWDDVSTTGIGFVGHLAAWCEAVSLVTQAVTGC